MNQSGSRPLAVASGCLLAAVASAGILVGAYAVWNPNGIEFGAAWPLAAELMAVAAALALGHGMHAQRRRTSQALFALDLGAALVALLVLCAVAFILGFNQL